MIKDVEEELKRVIRVLGFQQRVTPEMRTRRFYQFQQWLLTPGRDDLAVLKAANSTFDSLKGSHSVAIKLHQRCEAGKILPSEAVEYLLKNDPMFRRDFDASYFGYRTPDPTADATGCSELLSSVISSVNIFTHYCLQLSRAKKRNVKGIAKKLYAYAAMQDSQIIKDIEKHRTDRRSRLAFLYVAERHNPRFLQCPPDQIDLYAFLEWLAEDRGVLQEYFARCAYVQSVLANRSELAPDRIAAWAGVEILPLPELDGLSDAEIKAAEHFDDSRSRKRHRGRVPSEGLCD